MNKNTLVGFLIARYRAAKQQRFHVGRSTLSLFCKGVPTNTTSVADDKDGVQKSMLDVHHTTPVNMYTLKQLRDTVQNMQQVWNPYNCVEMPGITEAVDACLHRFGVLASMPHCGIIMDDQGDIHIDKITGFYVLCTFRFKAWFAKTKTSTPIASPTSPNP
jgi:hypothetical protein